MFTDGQKIVSFKREDGVKIRQADKDERPLIVLGIARGMMIVMQPSHGGMAPWIYIDWGEGGFENEYINVATVQSIIFEEK